MGSSGKVALVSHASDPGRALNQRKILRQELFDVLQEQQGGQCKQMGEEQGKSRKRQDRGHTTRASWATKRTQDLLRMRWDGIGGFWLGGDIIFQIVRITLTSMLRSAPPGSSTTC